MVYPRRSRFSFKLKIFLLVLDSIWSAREEAGIFKIRQRGGPRLKNSENQLTDEQTYVLNIHLVRYDSVAMDGRRREWSFWKFTGEKFGQRIFENQLSNEGFILQLVRFDFVVMGGGLGVNYLLSSINWVFGPTYKFRKPTSKYLQRF